MKDDTKTPVFPCNIGDTVYEVEEGQILKCVVIGFRIGRLMVDDEDEDEYSDVEWNIDLDAGFMQSSLRLSQFGKTLFLTREDARKALFGNRKGMAACLLKCESSNVSETSRKSIIVTDPKGELME